jgi:hypothetical protein
MCFDMNVTGGHYRFVPFDLRQTVITKWQIYGCEVRWEQRNLHLVPGTPDVVQDTATEVLSSW